MTRTGFMCVVLLSMACFSYAQGEVQTEFFDFDDNQVPPGWVLENLRGAGIVDGALRAWPIDGNLWFSKIVDLTVAQSLRIEFDSNIQYTYWGMGSGVELLAEPQPSLSSGPRTGPWYRTFSGIWPHGLGLVHFSDIGEFLDDMSQGYLNHSLHELQYTDYHYVYVVEDGMISWRAERISDGGVLFDYQTAVSGLTVADLQQVAIWAGTTGTVVWIDNLLVEQVPAAPPNTPPVADAGPDLEYSTDAACTATAQLDGSRSFDIDDDPLTYSWDIPGVGVLTGLAPTVSLTPGAYYVGLTVDDGREGADWDELFVSVVDASPPAFVDPPLAIVAECQGPAGTPVALPQVSAHDSCDGPVAVTHDAPASFELGATAVTYAASDEAGNNATAAQLVTIVDTTAPLILGAAPSPAVLWPPNHKLRQVEVDIATVDSCTGAAAICRITSVSSNEDQGANAPDWRITGDLTVELRSERRGSGDGREYTLGLTCVDPAGNDSAAEVRVLVPHDQG